MLDMLVIACCIIFGANVDIYLFAAKKRREKLIFGLFLFYFFDKTVANAEIEDFEMAAGVTNNCASPLSFPPLLN
jgi:hypothetical protein